MGSNLQFEIIVISELFFFKFPLAVLENEPYKWLYLWKFLLIDLQNSFLW